MCNEYDRSLKFLHPMRQPLNARPKARDKTYIIPFPLINQTAEQIFGVINDICYGVSERCVGIVSETKDPGTRDVQREVVSKPERFAFGARPGLDRITIESVDSNNTESSQGLAPITILTRKTGFETISKI